MALGLMLMLGTAAAAATDRPLVVAQAGVPPETVGEAPPGDEVRPEVMVAADIGGVLTPAGRLVLEPSLRLSHTSARRFTFRGIELVDTVLVGVIEAEEADRNFIETALTARLGITDRLEVSVRVPGVYRDDRVTFLIPGIEDPPVQSRSLDALGIGDVEATVNAQINRAGTRWPIFVANLRGRFPTGDGPFDVSRDAFGIETELPTGSGFYSFEPSVTILYPVDPVVFFANVGYQWNIRRNVNTQIGNNFVSRVDPGDAIRGSLGMGFAITDRTSISLGYSHDYIMKTRTRINDVTLRSSTLQVGTLTVGYSHRFTDRVRADVSVDIGATSEATDASVLLRVPIAFDLF